jgi:hypothetical protein
MAIISSRLQLAYFDVPKIACTSLKTMFWEIEMGRDFQQLKQKPSFLRRAAIKLGLTERPNTLPIHDIDGYRTRSFRMVDSIPEGYATLAVIRDPAARFHSAWRNRVGKHVLDRHNTREDLFNEGLTIDPDFGTFIDNFDGYCSAARLARVHTLPYSWHLGPDISFYDHIFKIEEMDRLVAFLSKKAGQPVRLPHDNIAANDKRSNKISRSQADKLEKILAPDYEWLSGIYEFDKGVHRFL